MAVHTSRPFRWLPNALTGLRIVLVGPIFMAALSDAWVLGFWLVIIALLTDFADGLAAKKLDAYTPLGQILDPIADFLLAATGILTIIATGHLPLWVGCVMLLPALYVGYVKFIAPSDAKVRIMQPVFSVPYLFAVWAVTAWFFAGQAYGWAWWYIIVAAGILAIAALFKRHRLRAWFGGVAEHIITKTNK